MSHKKKSASSVDMSVGLPRSTKPKVFISSTVYDFRDMRSAIKYWLEEHGYEVRLSDHTDFPQNPALNSYESCLLAIDDSDYFVLLIGGRVGGWYDKDARVSITRFEYRRAYERAKEGKLRLLAFVRREVWDIREDRGQLKKFLIAEHGLEGELKNADIAAITAHPSKFITDAEAIFAFLEEVGRVPEMKAAAVKKADLPRGNWIYQFVNFRDIADALKVGMRIKGTLHRATLAANLRYEVVQNLRKVTLKKAGGEISPIYRTATLARSNITSVLIGQSTLTGIQVAMLSYLLLTQASVGSRLRTIALHEAVTSGVFLDFDRVTGQYVVGLPQQALLLLMDAVRGLSLVSAQAIISLESITKNCGPENMKKSFQIENGVLMPAAILHDNLRNFIATSVAFLNYLSDGDEGADAGAKGTHGAGER